jgi:hypothetical protein
MAESRFCPSSVFALSYEEGEMIDDVGNLLCDADVHVNSMSSGESTIGGGGRHVLLLPTGVPISFFVRQRGQ